MKKLMSSIIICLLLTPLPALAMGQYVYANDQYVGPGSNEMNDHYGGPVLHVPIQATAKALGVPVKISGDALYVGNHVTSIAMIKAWQDVDETDLYVPMTWLVDTCGWHYDINKFDTDLTNFNFYIPQKDYKNHDITVYVNDEEMYTDVSPVIVNGRTYVPFRALFETLGGDVTYQGESNVVKTSKGFTSMEFCPGNNFFGMSINEWGVLEGGELYYFERPESPFIKDGRTMVPLRLAAEMLGANVEWNDETKEIYINGQLEKFTPPDDAIKAETMDDYYNKVYFNE